MQICENPLLSRTLCCREPSVVDGHFEGFSAVYASSSVLGAFITFLRAEVVLGALLGIVPGQVGLQLQDMEPRPHCTYRCWCPPSPRTPRTFALASGTDRTTAEKLTPQD